VSSIHFSVPDDAANGGGSGSLRAAIEANIGNCALVLGNFHGPAGVLFGTLAPQISDRLFAKGERLAVVGKSHTTELLTLGSVTIPDDEAIDAHGGTHIRSVQYFREVLIRTALFR
jgi:hypothetical protein